MTTAVTQSNEMICKSPKLKMVLEVARRVATSQSSILISGESGVGKEIFAKFIHRVSRHHRGPFIAVNCSAIPENLIESELFGHSKGSFTGAIDKRVGLFEAAENGTLFLDEIGDLNLCLQAKILRVLQEHTIKRVGDNQERPINCRIIAATHVDLAAEVVLGRFREDLYFRLNVIPLLIPPLRERVEDLLPLADFYLKRFARDSTRPIRTFSNEAIRYLQNHPWRGNVRELVNTVERAVALSEDSEIRVEDFMPTTPGLGNYASEPIKRDDQSNFEMTCENGLPSITDVIHQYIEFAVKKNGGARDRTAREIGIDRKTLYRRMKDTPTHGTSKISALVEI